MARSARIASLLAITVLTTGLNYAFAASDTWNTTTTLDGLWTTNGNWLTAAPGDLSTTTNTDTATFNSASDTTTIAIDFGRNIQSLLFDTATAAGFTIGTTGGNTLLLSDAGSITVTSAVVNAQTVNAPLVLEGTTYAFVNNATTTAANLTIGGAVTGATGNTTVLTLDGTNTGANTVSGSIANGTATSLAVTKSGTGTWNLTSANTYTGGTIVNDGTLNVAAVNALGTGPLQVNGGTLSLATFSVSVGAVTLTGGSITGSAGGVLTGTSYSVQSGTISAILGGSGALTKTTAGTVILSGANTFTGGMTISGGTVSIGAENNLGAAPFTPTVNVTIDGGTLKTTAGVTTNANRIFAIGPNGATFQSTSGNLTLLLTSGASTAVAIQDAGPGAGALTIAGTSNYVANGRSTYTGGTIFQSGLIVTLNSSAGPAGAPTAGPYGTGFIRFAGATMRPTTNSNANVTLANAVEFAADTTFVAGSTNTLTFNGPVTLLGSTRTITDNSTGQITFSGAIGDGGNGYGLTLGSSSTAKLILSGLNTFTGPTTINGGILAVSTLANIGSASGVGAGIATNDGTNAASLVINGGTLEYTGTASSSNRLITLGTAGGTLSSTNATAANTITFSNAGSVVLAGTDTPRTLTFAGTNTGANTFALAIGDNGTGATTVAKTGASLWVLSGINNYTGPTNITGGILAAPSLTNIGSPSSIGLGIATNDATNAASLVLNGGALQYNSTAGAASTNRLFTLGTGGGTLDSSSTNAANTVTFSNTGNVVLAGTNAARTLTLTGTNTGSNTLAQIIGDNGTGATTVTKTGTGTWVLSATNTYTGGTNLNGGLLNFATLSNLGAATSGITFNGGTLQWATGNTVDISTRTVTLTGAGTFDTNSNDVMFSNAIGNAGTGTLTKAGAGTLTLAAGNTYGGTTIIGGTVQTAANNALPTAGAVIIGNNSTSTGNLNLGAFNQAVSGLTVSSNNATADTITIGTGKTLSVNGDVTLGSNTTGIQTTNVTFAGGGALAVSKSGGLFQVGGVTTNSTSISNAANVNLSALSQFSADLGATGTFRVGDNNPGGSTPSGGGASTLLLAPVSTITAGTLSVGGSEAVNVTQTLTLGVTSTTLNADTIFVGVNNLGVTARSNGVINFASGTGTLSIHAADGTGRANLNIVNSTPSTASNFSGTMNLTGHSANLYLGTLEIARRTANTGTATGTFVLDTGTLDVTNVIVGSKSGTSTATGTIAGTFTIGSATAAANSYTAIIGSGGISMASNVTTSGTASATVNFLGGGTITVNGDIIKAAGSTGTATASFTLDGAILDMTGHNIGGATAINTLSFLSGTLKNVAEINGGVTPLTKSGTGTLLLTGTNTWTGGTTVSAGALTATSSAVIGSGTLQLNGGTFSVVSDSNQTFTNAVAVGGAATLQIDRATAGATPMSVTFGSLSLGAFNLTMQAGANLTTDTAYGVTFGNATLTGAGTLTTSNNGTGVATVTLGTVSGSFGLTKAGGGTLIINGAATTGSPFTMSGGVVTLNGNGNSFSTLTSASATTFNVNGNTTFTGATSLTGATYGLNVAAGVTLTVNNAFTLGSDTSTSLTFNTPTANVGTFVMNNPAQPFIVGNRTTGTAFTTTLDATGLNVFNVTASNFYVSKSSNQNVLMTSTLTLPNGTTSTSNISVAAGGVLAIGSQSGNGGQNGTLNLGSGTYTIWTPTLKIGDLKTGATFNFLPNATGSLTMAGAGGVGKINVDMGNNTAAGTATNPTATLNLTTTGTVNAAFGTITMGTNNTNNGAGGSTNLFTLNAGGGTVTADTVTVGVAQSTTGTLNATFEVDKGTFQFNPGTGFVQGSGTSTRNFTLNVPGGMLDMNNSPINAIGTSILSLTGGTIKNASTVGNFGTLTFTGGTFLNSAVTVQSISHSIAQSSTAAASLLQVDAGQTTAITGTYTLTGGTNTAMATINGTLTTTGAITVQGGIFNDSGAVTAASLDMQSGTATINGTLTTTGAVNVQNGSLSGTGSVLAGSYTVQAGTVGVALTGAAATLTKSTTGTVVLSGANTYGGVTTISAGALQFGSAGAIGGPGQSVTVAVGATAGMDFTVANGLQTALNTRFVTSSAGAIGVTATSAGEAIDFSSTGANLTAAYLGAVGNVTYTGTLTPNVAGAYRLGGFSGNLTYQTAITGTSTVTVGGNVTFNNAKTYAGTTFINQGTLFFTADQNLGALTFGATASSTTTGTLDLTNANATFSGATLVQTNSVTDNQIKIGSGKTLTLTNNVTIGPNNTGSNNTTILTATGGGTLVINNTASGSTVQIGQSQNASNSRNSATLDLQGLDTFTASLNTTNGLFRVSNPATINVGDVATLKLPTTGNGNTTITAKTFSLGDGGDNSGSSVNVLQLGSGQNTFNVDVFNVGAGSAPTQRDVGSLTYNVNAPNGTLKIRSAADPVNGRANFNIATGGTNVTTGVAGNNTVDLTGHTADLWLNTLAITNTFRNVSQTNSFSFNQGTLDATTVQVGFLGAAAGTQAVATHTTNVNLGGGTVSIRTGGLELANSIAANTTNAKTVLATVTISGGTVTIANNTTFGAAVRLLNNSGTNNVNNMTGTLDITGGTVTLSGDMIKGAVVGTGANSAVLKLRGGTLDMGDKKIGGSLTANNLTSLTFASGQLLNVAEINNGATLDKTSTDTLTLAGTNTYTGITSVNDGMLLLNSVNALPGGITATGGTNNLVINGTAGPAILGLGAGDFTRGLGTGTTQVQFTGQGGGFAAFGADRIVNLSGASVGVTWGTGGFVPSGVPFVLGTASATNMVDFQNPIDVSGANRTIQVDNGAAVIDAKISGAISGTGGITKTGAGTLSLTATNSYTGDTTVSAGTLQIAGLTNGANTTVTQNTQLSANRIIQANLTLQGSTGNTTGKATINVSGANAQGSNSGASHLGTLAIANDGATLGTRVYQATFDLKNNDLVIDNTPSVNDGTANSQLAKVSDMIRAGMANNWTGTGITSSYIASQSPNLNSATALGVMRNVVDPTIAGGGSNTAAYSTFDGYTLAGNETLVKYTWYGDADLDGKLTSFDFALLDAGFAGAKQFDGKAGWFLGDFDYSGSVDQQDYSLLNAGFIAFNGGGGNPTIGGGTQLPEPNSLLLGVIGLAGLVTAYRRRTAIPYVRDYRG